MQQRILDHCLSYKVNHASRITLLLRVTRLICVYRVSRMAPLQPLQKFMQLKFRALAVGQSYDLEN